MSSSPEEYVAYRGKYFTVEWYFNDRKKSQALEYAENLPAPQKRKLLVLLKAMGDIGQIRDITKFRYEGDQIFAFKPVPHRFLCFFYAGGKIIVTNAFAKRQNKLPKGEKLKALQNKKRYEERVKEGRYYEEKNRHHI